MFKKLYRKDGFIYIDETKIIIQKTDKNSFIVKEIAQKNGETKKKGAVKAYYIQRV